AAATMQMEENAPRGVVVRLTLPLTRSSEPTFVPMRAAPESRPAAPATVAPAVSRT
ncbi:MAG: sensor histidine kinase, partial [Cupriavidus sp.]|nr:sensor histidine kinase [Cupriavidus sp.]